MAKSEDHYTRVAEQLIEKLKEGTAPWQQPWDAGGYGSRPMNPTTGKPYRGGNMLYLMMQGHGDPRWMTYRQAQSVGAQVRKGEKGTPIIYWKFEEERTVHGDNGKPVRDTDGNAVKEKVQLERPRSFISYVFNADQIEGLEPLLTPEKPQGWADVTRAEKLLEASGAKIVNRKQAGAFYRPGEDAIYLPLKAQFSDEVGYYSTALHELGHWTGHETRLNRESGPFGSISYAKEELRAEIGSMMLSAELGIGVSVDSHAAYVQSWIKVLQDDPREIFRAAADAEKICDFIMDLELTQEQRLERQTERESFADATPFMDDKVQDAVSRKEGTVSREVSSPEKVRERIYLNVPYREKDAASDLGAKWDRREKSWYVPEGKDVEPFGKWLGRDESMQERKAQDPVTAERIYLAVAYQDHWAAKKAGAEWDKDARSWYVGPKGDMEKLKRWLPENVKSQQMPPMSPREEFGETLRNVGCTVEGEHPVMDGKPHRIRVEGDREGAQSGFYVGHMDGRPAGYAKNNRTGEEIRWKSQGAVLSTQDRAAFKATCECKQAERAAAQLQEQENTAQRVAGQLLSMRENVDTPYLNKKGLGARKGVFLGEDGKTTCIPAFDADGKLWTMQYIQEDGTKRFAKNGRKEGCFTVAGGGMDALRNAPAIVIAEGYATAGSISDGIAAPVVAAFDSGNLMAVAKALHDKYHDKAVIVAGDDDQHLLDNPRVRRNVGREKAEMAAEAVGGKAVFPIFAPGEREKDCAGFTDFNDLGTKSKFGMAAVERQLKPAIEKAITEKVKELERNKQQERSRSEGMER